MSYKILISTKAIEWLTHLSDTNDFVHDVWCVNLNDMPLIMRIDEKIAKFHAKEKPVQATLEEAGEGEKLTTNFGLISFNTSFRETEAGMVSYHGRDLIKAIERLKSE